MPRLLHPSVLSCAVLLAPFAGPAPARAGTEPPRAAVEARDLLGRPVAALLELPGVALRLRMAAGGWQRVLAEAVRQPGPPLRLAEDGRHLYAWGCAPEAGCAEQGAFLAWDPAGERLFAVLMEGGRPALVVPPRAGGSWPAALAGPVREFSGAAAGWIRFGR